MRVRGLDHVVPAVERLKQAGEALRRLDATTPPAWHPFGTANILVQLQENLPELLAAVDAGSIQPHEAKMSFNVAPATAGRGAG